MRWWQRLIANDTVQFRCNNSFVLSSVAAARTSYLRFHLWTLNPQVCGFSSSLAGIPLQTRGRLPGIFHFQQLFEARCSETNHFLSLSEEQRFHILVIVPRVSLQKQNRQLIMLINEVQVTKSSLPSRASCAGQNRDKIIKTNEILRISIRTLLLIAKRSSIASSNSRKNQQLNDWKPDGQASQTHDGLP